MKDRIANTAFISLKSDAFVIGGLSILAFVGLIVFGDHLSVLDIFSFAMIMAIFVNGPHFLISYLLFYRLARTRVFREASLFVVAFVVPGVILIALITAGISGESTYLIAALFVMFFMVGWHYVRQGFGILLVYAANDRNFFSVLERRVIKWSLYALWMGSFFNIFSAGGLTKEYWGLKYMVPEIPLFLPKLFSLLAILSILPIIGTFFFRYKRGVRDNPVGLTGLFIQYLWLLPSLKHPQFLLVIPLFHSLQYLLFAGNVVNNYERVRSPNSILKNTLLYWWGAAFILAALLFEVIPKFLDSAIGAPQGLDMPHFFLIGFILFINIHHYFIDAVLWKREFGLVRPYLKPSPDRE